MTTSRYRSKIDAWLGSLLAIAVLLPIAFAVYELATAPDTGEMWAVLPAVVLPFALITWLVRTTDYTFDEHSLVVRSGPFRSIVPLAKIDAVTPTRTLVSSPALSLDRIEIRFNRHDAVVISPHRREAFLAELEQRRSASHERTRPVPN